jgi:hypothetical protein
VTVFCGHHNRRLRSKLNSGLVVSVWLQFGSDVEALRSGLKFLQNEITRRCSAHLVCFSTPPFLESLTSPCVCLPCDDRRQRRRPTQMRVYGSVFLPSRQFLARMKFRPWNGVHLSKKYLGGCATSSIVLFSGSILF